MTAARLKSQNGDLLVRDGTTDTSIKSGVAKAYQHHDEDLTTMHKSLNLSSSTDNGLGDFTANFTSSWLDARYMYSFGVDDNGFNDATAYTIKGYIWATSSHRTRTLYTNSSNENFFDQDMACIIWHGDLA
jgi:hypothetical protein